jgi:hypothetical protein
VLALAVAHVLGVHQEPVVLVRPAAANLQIPGRMNRPIIIDI